MVSLQLLCVYKFAKFYISFHKKDMKDLCGS